MHALRALREIFRPTHARKQLALNYTQAFCLRCVRCVGWKPRFSLTDRFWVWLKSQLQYWYCPHRTRIYSMRLHVGCPSICLPQHGPTAANPSRMGLLLWVRRAGDIDRSIDCCTAGGPAVSSNSVVIAACDGRMRAVPRCQRMSAERRLV